MTTKKVLLATTNGSKFKPFKKAWFDLGLNKEFELVTLLDIEDKNIDVKEDTGDFEKDSIKKALEYAKAYNMISISLDRGIEISSLDNWPGTKTKEVFAGREDVRFLYDSVDTSDQSAETEYGQDIYRSELVLRKIKDDRRVNSVYGIAIALPDGSFASDKVIVNGTASDSLRITKLGYYYDWFFVPEGEIRTLSELSEEEYLEYSSKVLWPITPKIKEFLINLA